MFFPNYSIFDVMVVLEKQTEKKTNKPRLFQIVKASTMNSMPQW